MLGLGLPELIVILLIVLLLFGNRLPKLSRTIGESGRELKEGFNGDGADKSLSDIAKEVRTSTAEIKNGIVDLENN